MNAERVEFSKEEIALLDGLSLKLDYLPPEEKPGVMNAATFMMKAFRDSEIPNRDSGPIWASHSIETMKILADWHLPALALQEGGLHDVIEDTAVENTAETSHPVILNDLSKAGFSSTVVDGVARLGVVKKYHDEQQKKRGITDDFARDQELRAMFFESLIDHPSVVLVRTAERLQNLETLWPRFLKNPQSAERTARESLEVYLPFLWELGMYETANLYADYALGVLYHDPDQFKAVLRNFLPTFRGEQESMRKNLADVMGIDLQTLDDNPLPIAGMKATKLNVYPPSYHDLATLLSERGDIREIYPEEVPYLADVVYENVSEVFGYVVRLISSGLFNEVPESVQRFWIDLKKGGARPYYLTLIPKTDEGVIPSPIKITFLTQDMLIARQASILHLHQVSEVDERLRKAAEKKVSAVRQRIEDVKPTGSPRPERESEYESAVLGEMMAVSYRTNGEVKSVSVKKGSSIMDVLLKALTPVELVHCRGVNTNRRGRPFSFVVGAFSQLDIDIDQSDIYLTPSWLDDFRQSDEKRRFFVKSALRNVIDGEPIDLKDGIVLNYQTEYRDKVIASARQRALTGIERRYSKKSGLAAGLRLNVTAGFDEELRKKYGKDRELFLIDAGIGAVNEQKLDLLVRNLIDIRKKKLIPITLYVPLNQDQPGWQSVFAGVVKKAGMNTRVLDGGGSNEEGMEMFITYYCEPPAGLSPEGLPLFLEQIKYLILTACREEFHLTSDPLLIYEIPQGLKRIKAKI